MVGGGVIVTMPPLAKALNASDDKVVPSLNGLDAEGLGRGILHEKTISIRIYSLLWDIKGAPTALMDQYTRTRKRF